jgi:hypothetical protein
MGDRNVVSSLCSTADVCMPACAIGAPIGFQGESCQHAPDYVPATGVPSLARNSLYPRW